jgi:alkyl hydroperoxide reductase subunit AhpF
MTAGPLLGELERTAIRDAFTGIERDVAVTLELGPVATPVTLLAAGGREIDSGAVTRGLVAEVCGLSDRLELTVVEHQEAGPWPRTTIGEGLVYQGMPVGYELTTVVHAIVEAGRERPSLSPDSIERLGELEHDTAIDVFVTPT